MRAGDLRHKVTFQQPSYTSDAYSHSTVSWTDKCTAWIALWPLRGQERLESMQLKGRLTHKVRARYRKDLETLDESWRIKYIPKTAGSTRYFNIKSVVNVEERDVYFDILAEEVKS